MLCAHMETVNRDKTRIVHHTTLLIRSGIISHVISFPSTWQLLMNFHKQHIHHYYTYILIASTHQMFHFVPHLAIFD